MGRRAWNTLHGIPLLVVVAACSENTALPTLARPAPDHTVAAESGGSAGTGTPVTSLIADADAGTGQTFQIRSDGGGPYTNSRTLTSVIQSIGDWEVDSYSPKGSTRMVDLDFSRPIDGSGPNGGAPAPIPSGTYHAIVITRCHVYNTSFLTLAPGQSMRCPLHVGQLYDAAGTQYAVHMNPDPTDTEGSWPETQSVQVNCNSSAGSCANWTVRPTGTAPDGSPANVAALLEYVTTTVKGHTTTSIVKLGDFYMSFRFDVTNP